jgi:RpiB/LacA/LacB family sugar-phosphate isomerase
MRLAIAADHAGYMLKTSVVEELRAAGHDVLDLGTCDETPVDYPDFARLIANALRSGQAERGILICGSGVGAAVAANKFAGIRAGLCHDTYSAHQGVEHDAMNVLCLGGRVIGAALATELIHAFVGATYAGELRHQRRLAKIEAIERECAAAPQTP